MDLEESHRSNPEEEKEPGVSSKPEPRRRSLSASYGPISSSYHCNLCQITVNSQSQLAQVSSRGPRGRNWPLMILHCSTRPLTNTGGWVWPYRPTGSLPAARTASLRGQTATTGRFQCWACSYSDYTSTTTSLLSGWVQANYVAKCLQSAPLQSTHSTPNNAPGWIGSFRNCKHFRAILSLSWLWYLIIFLVIPPWSQQLCSVRCVSVSIVVDLTDNWSGIFINISRHNSAKVFVGGWKLSGVCKLHQTLLSGPVYWCQPV